MAEGMAEEEREEGVKDMGVVVVEEVGGCWG